MISTVNEVLDVLNSRILEHQQIINQIESEVEDLKALSNVATNKAEELELVSKYSLLKNAMTVNKSMIVALQDLQKAIING